MAPSAVTLLIARTASLAGGVQVVDVVANAVAGTIAAQRQELERLQRDLVTTSDAALPQEVGVYEYRHPLENAEAYKAALEDLRQEIRDMVKGGHAFETTTEFTVDRVVLLERFLDSV